MKYLCGYKILAEIASGGFSTVYKVQETTPPYRYFAAKRFNRLSDFNIFTQEATSLAKVCHIAGTQTFFRAICHKDQLVILTEYIDGTSLKAQIKQHGPMSEAQALHIVLTLGNQLAQVHLSGLLHLDIKPSNILITAERHVILTDFGVASPLNTTRSEVVKTDFCYTAPEKYHGRQSTASDIYSLGATLFYLLTGTTPFPNSKKSSDAYQMLANCSQEIELPDTLSEPVQALLRRMLAKQDKERPTTPELLQQLQQCLLSDINTHPITPANPMEKDLPDESTSYATAARHNIPFAQYRYALILEEKDPAAAMHWYKEAAQQGFTRAQNNLALLYTERDEPESALHWLQQGAENNNPYCQYNLSRELRKRSQQDNADFWLSRAANQGHERAQNTLAIQLEEDAQFEEAFSLYQQAAYAGLTAAQYNLGLMYESRKTPDTSEADELATFWFQRAAQSGHLRAARKLPTHNEKAPE